jgi:hypothetical protein
MPVLGAELARRRRFIEHPVLSIHQRFLIYGVAGKTGTPN